MCIFTFNYFCYQYHKIRLTAQTLNSRFTASWGLSLFENLYPCYFVVFSSTAKHQSSSRPLSTSCIHVFFFFGLPSCSHPPGLLSKTFFRWLPGSERNSCLIGRSHALNIIRMPVFRTRTVAHGFFFITLVRCYRSFSEIFLPHNCNKSDNQLRASQWD